MDWPAFRLFVTPSWRGATFFSPGDLGQNRIPWDSGAAGSGPETTQALRHIETILRACGASLEDIVKVNVFLADMKTFPDMNSAYLAVMGADPPARITVGRAELALGGAVEIDCIAYKKE
jgi:enamine deaminase RidA (YjgF/YER057c/UK114 family)